MCASHTGDRRDVAVPKAERSDPMISTQNALVFRPETTSSDDTTVAYNKKLQIVRITAAFTPDEERKYHHLMETNCQLAKPIFRICQEFNYRPWVLRLSLPRNDVEWTKFPEFSWGDILSKQGFTIGAFRQMSFQLDRRVQIAGIIEINWDDMTSACEHQTHEHDNLLILSDREIGDDLEQIYMSASQALQPGLSGVATNRIHWGAVSTLLCPRGDIVVKTWGGVRR